MRSLRVETLSISRFDLSERIRDPNCIARSERLIQRRGRAQRAEVPSAEEQGAEVPSAKSQSAEAPSVEE
jgi:hypothetical protein